MISFHTLQGVFDIDKIQEEEHVTVYNLKQTPKHKIYFIGSVTDEDEQILMDHYRNEMPLSVNPEGMTAVTCLIVEMESKKDRYNLNVVKMVLFQT
ncbi:MAG: hypothetical protein MIO92_06970 [Methanosarcinaceae archaeon]|nr:hypothetical protein [Methanosarcinaceae archaeon]